MAWNWSRPDRLPDRLYKFVDASVADNVEAGSLRIGTFNDYAQLDGVRSDSGEAMVTRKVDNALFEANNPHMHKVGISVHDTAQVWVLGRTSHTLAPNMFCFCMSKDLSAAPEEDHVAFTIENVGGFLEALTLRNSARLGDQIANGSVTYGPRIGSYDDDTLRDADPFVKDTSFAWEQEYRAVWYMPFGEMAERRDDARVAAFVTDPDASIASFLRRL